MKGAAHTVSTQAAGAMLGVIVNLLYFGAAYYFGERAWHAATQRRALEERTRELERERERSAAQAVELERVRLARELHDIVAHHVSVMGVQAGAARIQLAHDTDAAGATLASIESTAREALTELRQLLRTLRDPDGGEASPPAPGLAGLDALAQEASGAGLPTSVAVVGAEAQVPELAQVNLYRIAQEALTNARRHGGAGARAEVRLRYLAGAVELEVSNTGSRVTELRTGLGHTGMRERAAASGGTVELAPRTGGGFLVRARLPLSDAAIEVAP